MKKFLQLVMMLSMMVGSSYAAPIDIVNGDFETGADNDSPAGWTDTTPISFWLGQVSETGNPIQSEWDSAPASLGTFILTTARQSAGAGSQPTDGQLTQIVDLSAFAADIAVGDQILNVDFVWGSDDSRDTGSFSLIFFDAADNQLATSYSVALDDGDGYSFTGWIEETVGGLVPVSAQSVMLQIDTTRTGGSETNIWIDNITGSIDVPEPASMVLLSLGALAIRRRK